jgi:hypothetical protein
VAVKDLVDVAGVPTTAGCRVLADIAAPAARDAACLAGLRAAGVPRVHLGMAVTNVSARAFYDRLGFTEIPVPGATAVTYLGRGTAE